MYRRLLNLVTRNSISNNRFNLLNKKNYSDTTSSNMSINTNNTKIVRNFELENQNYKIDMLEEKHNKALQKIGELERNEQFNNYVTFILSFFLVLF